MDHVMRVNRLPAPGETIMVSEIQSFPGGKGANQAVAAARLGAAVRFLGCVGDDESGKTLVNNLEQSGVDVSSIAVDAGISTGTAVITVEDSGENAIFVYPGANSKLSSEMVQNTALSGVSAVVASLEVPIESVRVALQLAKEQGITTVLNPAPAQDLDESIYEHVDYLIPNETELAYLSGLTVETIADVKKASAKLLGLGVKAVVATLGSNGAYFFSQDEQFHVPALKVKAVDATAAGDSFVAAFTTKIMEGSSPREAVEFAGLVGAVTVTRLGAQSSLPTLQELTEFKRTHAL